MIQSFITAKVAGAVARHFLTVAGGYLVAKGYADEGTVAEITGGGVALAGVVWSVLEKKAAFRF